MSAFLWIFSTPWVPPAAAETERILQFDSRIVVQPDGSMKVWEDIKVHCAGQEIKRGIYRDFPTTYRDQYGNRVKVDFEVLDVVRDGKAESYHVERISNGKRVYMGRKDVFLPHGVHSYTLVYRTNRQLGFFQDHDELYWNVTGNGWSFAIESARATVELPQGVSRILFLDGFTGPQGAVGKDFRATTGVSGIATFATTEPLMPKEGLTIVVAWPKGFVAEPSGSARFLYFIKDNAGVMAGFFGVVLLLVYYLVVWSRVGKDPEAGTIIPLFTPPDGFSPAQVRYVREMAYDNEVFAAAVINMAVKGHLKISDEDGTVTLTKQSSGKAPLSAEEKTIAQKLFGGQEHMELKTENHAVIGAAVTAIQKALKMNFEKVYFLTNTRYFVPGLIISVLAYVGAIVLDAATSGVEGLFAGLWLSGWTVGVVFLFIRTVRAWKEARGKGRISAYAGALFTTLFFLPFAAGEVMGIYFLATATSVWMVLDLLLVVLVNGLFYALLKAPTRAGRFLLDKIEGFRMYLSVAEKDRLNILNPPEKTPELFEKYLPYALALGVEQDWAEQFSDVLAAAKGGEGGYSPVWYSGHSWSHLGGSGFASSLGSSLSSAISSSSTAPGSSSGGGGSSSPGARPSGSSPGGGGSGERSTGRRFHEGRGTVSGTSTRWSAASVEPTSAPKGAFRTASVHPPRAARSIPRLFSDFSWSARAAWSPTSLSPHPAVAAPRWRSPWMVVRTLAM
ncbi:MAG: DUF2207 domain-containing protein [Syntrophobacteraceae bacterium]|nr:DUF2207 domain-containing protein [Syntrophobacteraceae bacterium]